MADSIGIVEIDLEHLGECEITFAILGRADFAFNGVTGAQAILAHHIGRNVDVVRSGEIVCLGRTQEAEAVGEYLNRAFADDLLTILCHLFQDREHQILLAQR